MSNSVAVTDATFLTEIENHKGLAVVDFWAAWCGPCRVIAPAIEELANDFKGRAKIGKLDVDHNPQTAMQYGVRSIPTLLFFKDGRVADQLIGAVPKKVMADKLEALSTQPA